ncbi:MAG: glutamine-hydrolyzing GMP synthase [Desulfovibrionaceae bacterium]
MRKEEITQRVLIIDYGSQVTNLIARRIRELGVYSEIISCTQNINDALATEPKAIILSGGPSNVYDTNSPLLDERILSSAIPILGICYGMQLLAHSLKGSVISSANKEYGSACLSHSNNSLLFNNIPTTTKVWMSHGDEVSVLPEGFICTSSTCDLPIASMENELKQIYAVQFHPEVSHTEEGIQLFRNFLFHIAKITPTWSMANYMENSIQDLRTQLGNEHVLCALSGGVDSTVVALLLHKAIGKNLHCFFVDTGLLRSNESIEIMEYLRKYFTLNLHCIDAKAQFIAKLSGVTDPEEKRKIIGKLFIEIFEQEAQALDNIQYLAQGTLYPDIIESFSQNGPSESIKSHHNVGGLPKNMKMKLVEPVKELFKDEVRKLGKELGLPDSIIWRHPFPGPGLAIRVIGEVTERRIAIVQHADNIVLEEFRESGYYNKVWQAFAILLPLKTVGVMGDGRTYEYTIALRVVESTDAMTADWSRLPYSLLESISRRIINEVTGVNRVVYDISSKPPSTIEWE